MTSRTLLIRNRPFARSGHTWHISLAVFACVIVAPAVAQAHGAMSGDELGPPLLTSGLLGFVCYWLVMLWPSHKMKDDQAVGAGKKDGPSPLTAKRSPQNSARIKRRPHLRKIETNSQVYTDQQARRKASDG